MNERIKELSKEAWAWAEQQEYTDPAKEFSDILEQKFAELIVQECAKVSKRTGALNEADFEGEMIADAIIEHFGIEP